MKFRNKLLAITGIVAASMGWGLWQGTLVGKAFDASPQGVLNSAPQGLKVDGNDYFKRSATIGNSSDSQITNAAQVMTGANGDGVVLSQYGSSSQYQNTGGAIWSNGKSFNMYEDQRASMWIFMGTDDWINHKAGDGMAFVLQNSSNSAFSSTGESLGVWGVDPNTKDSTSQTVANSAIPNSWAIEFDTHENQKIPDAGQKIGTVSPDAFDIGKYDPEKTGGAQYSGLGYDSNTDTDDVPETIPAQGNHIAANYPGDSGAYLPYQQNGQYISKYVLGIPVYVNGLYNYYGLAHRGLIRNSDSSSTVPLIADNTWHHITVNYKAPTGDSNTGTMTYSFGDQDLKTGAPITGTNQYAKESIDLSKLNVTKTNPGVYWGFTGTTGTNTETSMVVFEQVPGQANVNASAKLDDETTSSPISSGDTIKGNDAVKATYTLNYESGDKPWSNIKSSLNLPANINWSKAQITYPNSNIASSALSTANISNNKLDVKVEDLSSSANQAVITLEGNAINKNADSTATVTSFVGDNAIANTQLGKFSIKALPFSVNFNPKTVTANANTSATLTGSVSSTNAKVTGSNTTLSAGIIGADGNSSTDIPASDINLSQKVNSNGGYDFTIKLESVPAGASTVQVNASSTAAIGSFATDTATVTGGTVDFGDTSGNMVFETTTLTGSGTQTVARDESNGPWQLNVDSSLTAGPRILEFY
ncbi:hypothetical protein FC99_GL001681 [Levilactobacillus koreensis JCM 16448]|uniref:Uncharacterized protein n=1 Tax=Levilactobacillus koreensis TaxID=637971 RepID=A0AAC8UUL6_9LACO|nr:hypothetical protein [Levilactobacillus koreensis]AKP63937.1 hypothetical protein ABN16_02290 [Levilactobacillus koreensis]KRK86351.1 hypothetical protein FC99_GL001681 [Levilactobacillus koreensis JCM 16448]